MNCAGSLREADPDHDLIRAVGGGDAHAFERLIERYREHILEEKEILDEKQRGKFFAIILQQFAQGGLGVHDIKGRRKTC